MEVLQVLISQLALVLEVARARLVLVYVEKARRHCLRPRYVRRPRRLQLLPVMVAPSIHRRHHTLTSTSIPTFSRLVMLGVVGGHSPFPCTLMEHVTGAE